MCSFSDVQTKKNLCTLVEIVIGGTSGLTIFRSVPSFIWGTFKVVVAVVTRLAQIQAKVVLVSGSSMDSCKSSCTVVPLTPTEDEHKKRGQSINYKRRLAYFRKPKVLNQIRDHSVQSPARTETSLKTTLLTVSETLSFLKRTLRHTETPTRSVMNESVVQCESKQPFFFFFFSTHRM